MLSNILGNLTRQFKGLELLEGLLAEEYGFLQERDTDGITTVEFSIHELLRQMAVERVDLKNALQGASVLDYAGMLPEEDAAEIRKLYQLIDSIEQRCAKQASYNAELSLALLDQGQKLVTFLYEQITPRPTEVYGARGKLRQTRPEATFISGRL